MDETIPPCEDEERHEKTAARSTWIAYAPPKSPAYDTITTSVFDLKGRGGRP